jgi:hypothetical protein
VNVPQRGAIATLFAIAVLALINWASTWVTPSGKGIIVQGLTLLLAAFSWSAEGWTAFATLLTALATMILALCTYVQARLTREMIKVARDEYVASHRPKLILRQAFSLITDPLEATIVVQYTITNIGETRCWMTSCHLGVELVSELKYPLFVMTPDMSYPNNVPFIGAIGPGESKLSRSSTRPSDGINRTEDRGPAQQASISSGTSPTSTSRAAMSSAKWRFDGNTTLRLNAFTESGIPTTSTSTPTKAERG